MFKLNSIITPNDRYTPLLLNLGQNKLIPIINAKVQWTDSR